MSKTIEIDFHFNLIMLIIIMILLQDPIQSFAYYSINQYGNINVRIVELFISNFKSKRVQLFTHPFAFTFVFSHSMHTNRSQTTNSILWMLAQISWLIKTIEYNPVHSLDSLYLVVPNLASDLLGITHFCFEHWNKLDSIRFVLPFLSNSIFI